jgi:hypothetical protein
VAESGRQQAFAWVCAALLVLLLLLSVMGDGTWMGGLGMGWMMAVPVVLLGALVYFAYRYGRMEKAVEDLERTGKAP